ncbi:mitochondrial tRNA N6-threonyl-carbamoyl-adenosine (t6A) Sua5 [Schizosaccharomyces pombe]|uniref:Threonylcarbamoyl-AMP synthase n=1 Tax=Schizosaccharomyces pombe (strain 972 / ATCC 24843) TaxID=284812 RepID=SUA5_SCHPO|nr:putative SUA5/yciO/yrdC family protein Sua5 [Schizosaccharomyces pombe]O94530.1 RecName: Full=Threonylcarbamoyl-AMP synthase; Short=TC-AMP synthase; AltName: Full=L-threonylcarbamoyladenylate synthase; AltName: Full=t(6)A37 threonylcarbamoyladenosine biosynthesis protein sua5; AltName: Full=tRNA threonylcarbamoyladenosine biosynthesis protein sua5 [Schizosaccharomyces pombe 972h-]CAA22839.1 SUA5/yciO/yrdC family protein Sua5 (predicted) [Schizosaccharomyces pombe]|eukprot:NP_588044.1 putative SUA5/yciO/yrdC family protein Sua5 [Schizosaccharomyces pombe]
METKIQTVDTRLISFEKPSNDSEHPFEHTRVSIPPSETRSALENAANILRNTDYPVAFPTETVYGLGADARRTEAVLSIYKAKNRPADNPLIVHVASLDQLRRLLLSAYPKAKSEVKNQAHDSEEIIPKVYLPLIKKFWPGPLSILLPVVDEANPPVSPIVTAGQKTFAVRMPQHPVALALISISDSPLAAPSANASTRPSPTLAKHVYNDLQGKIPLILDGGACGVGVESTVVNGLCDPPVILRPGGISLEEIQSSGGAWERTKVFVAKKSDMETDFIPQTPGMKYRHYSPTAKVLLFVNYTESDAYGVFEKYLSEQGITKEKQKIGVLCSKRWNEESFPSHCPFVFLHMGRDGHEITKNLFAQLRDLDLQGVDFVLVEGVSEENEGLAIMNRLGKAASVVFEGPSH